MPSPTLLICEPDPLFQRLLAARLQPIEARPILCVSPREVEEQLETSRPRLILVGPSCKDPPASWSQHAALVWLRMTPQDAPAAGISTLILPISPNALEEHVQSRLEEQPEPPQASSPPETMELMELIDQKTFLMLQQLDKEDPGFLEEMLRSWLESSASVVSRLQQTLDEGDAEAIRGTAHTLKGSCGTIGAQALHKLASGIEAAACQGRLEQARALEADLARQYQDTAALFSEMLALKSA